MIRKFYFTRYIWIFFSFCTFAWSFEQLYMLPFEKKEASKKVVTLIKGAKKRIDIAMYSFTNKEFADALRDASDRGVEVRIVLDEKTNANEYSMGGYLAKYKNITLYTLEGVRASSGKYNGKMHTKMALIDGCYILFGSANWSLSAFDSNYETLFVSDEESLVQKGAEAFGKYLESAKKSY